MQRINEDIKKEQFQQIYLLYGEESYLRRQYRNRLMSAMCKEEDKMNVHQYEGKDISVGEVIDMAETHPFFAHRRVLFISDSGLFKAGGEKMAEYLKEPSETAFFIFTESEVDKRSKLFKAVQAKGCVVEFATQDENVLKRWIGGKLSKEGKKITEDTVKFLIGKTGTDMENISMELEKLICYCLDREVITKEDVDAICTTRISNHIFDMVSAIGDRKPRLALKLYYDLLALKEPPMRILFLIARQCNLLLQVKEMKGKGYDNKVIGSKVGLPPFIAGKYVTQAAAFRTGDLKGAVSKCVEAEESVKTGKMNDVMSVELLILSVLPS